MNEQKKSYLEGGTVLTPADVDALSGGARETMTSFTIPEGVTSIGIHAFDGCINLISIMVPDSVTSIGDYAFSCCSSLEKIFISPESIVDIGRYAYFGCNRLIFSTQIIESSHIISCEKWAYTVLPDHSAMLIQFLGSLEADASSNGELVIPDEVDGYPVTHIADKAFLGFYQLTHLTLPGFLRVIGQKAFAYCANLVEIRCKNYPDETVGLGNSICSIGLGAFDGCASLKRLILLHRDFATEQDTLFSDIELKIHKGIRVTNHALVSGDGQTFLLFCSGTKLKKYVIPKSVTTISPYAFRYASFSEIIIPPSVKSIGKCAFCDSELKMIKLPSGITRIENGVFSGCKKLQRVELPEQITYIGDSAFSGCYNLLEMKLPKNLHEMNGNAFGNCQNLTLISLNDCIDELGWNTNFCPKLFRIRLYENTKQVNINHLSKINMGRPSLRYVIIMGMQTRLICTEKFSKINLPHDFRLLVREGSQAEKDAIDLEIPHITESSLESIGSYLN